MVPFEGGRTTVLGKSRDIVESAQQTLSIFGRHNGCNGIAEQRRIDESNGATVVEHRTWKCSKAPTANHKMVGGGHTWPSEKGALPERIVDRVRSDIVATDQIVRLFCPHARPSLTQCFYLLLPCKTASEHIQNASGSANTGHQEPKTQLLKDRRWPTHPILRAVDHHAQAPDRSLPATITVTPAQRLSTIFFVNLPERAISKWPNLIPLKKQSMARSKETLGIPPAPLRQDEHAKGVAPSDHSNSSRRPGGGGGGIRTHGPLQVTRFPSVPIRPLSHSS